MTDREQCIVEFLHRQNLSHATREALHADASFRRYERITDGNKSYMLMDAPPEKEDIVPFIRVDEYLVSIGLSAPKIYAYDESKGLMLLEDLGDALFSSVLHKQPEQEHILYTKAVELLKYMHQQPVSLDVPVYDEACLMREVELLTQWFLPQLPLSKVEQAKATKDYYNIWKVLMAELAKQPKALVLRDYHADNLLWLSGRASIASVGVLDFQDALIGSPAYDMVSLLEDARRDVSIETVEAMKLLYMDGLAEEHKQAFLKDYTLLAAQRNCKIIGIFSRLASRDGKARYLDYMPRVWGHISRDIMQEPLQDLRQWMARYVVPYLDDHSLRVAS